MNQFNHKYKNLNDAVGISDSRRKELQDICESSWKLSRCISETIERVLSHGLSVIEVMYCGYLIGRVDENRCCGDPKIVVAKSPEDLMNKLKDLLKGHTEDQDEL
jgi:transcriptional regulatory protein LevR